MKLTPRCGTLFAVLLIALAVPRSARADLVALDLNTPGDGLLTLDTTTGLEWLDVTESIGMSFNMAVGNFPTFRHASEAEVHGIVNEFGVAANVSWTIANFIPAEYMLDTMGYVSTAGNTPYHQAFFDTGASTTDLALIQLDLAAGKGIANLPQTPLVSKGQVFASVGNYMVRISSVPEPTAFVMFGIAMTGFGLRRRRI